MALIKYAETHLSVDKVMNFISPLSNKGEGSIYEDLFYAMQLYQYFFYK